MKIRLNKINRLPLILPERYILTRLGYNHYLTGVTDRQRDKIMQDINEGFSLCEPRGISARLKITDNDGEKIVLEDGSVFKSSALAKLMRDSTDMWIAATTIGHVLKEAIDKKMAEADGKATVIYDAVGSETVDVGMDYLQGYVNKSLSRTGEKLTRRRFSPGYSDLELTSQRVIFNILSLEEWGLTLTDSMQILPEKSVTALAGIENAVQ